MSWTERGNHAALATLIGVTGWMGWLMWRDGALADGTTAPAYALVGLFLLFVILAGADAVRAYVARDAGRMDERDAHAVRGGDGFRSVAYRLTFVGIVILFANAEMHEFANLSFLVFAAIELVGLALTSIAYRRMA